MGNGVYTQTIGESIAKIVKHNKFIVDEGNIVMATVEDVYSDIMDTETFGTMSATIQPSGIIIPDIQLNAHINSDGSTGISGSYTFPKTQSTVFLALDIKNGKEFYYPLLYSHVEKVIEIYNTEKVSKVSEVTTQDANKPYDTEETGKSSEVVQSFDSITSTIVDDSGNETSIQTTSTTHSIDTGEKSSSEPAVLGDSLKTILSDLNGVLKNLTIDVSGITVSTTGTAAAQTGATDPLQTSPVSATSKSNIQNITDRLDEFLLNTVTLK